MSGNKFKEPKETREEIASAKPVRKKSRPLFSKFLNKLMNMFGIFERNQIVSWMPYILFVTSLVIIYIANSYYTEGIIREIDKTKKDLKEKRAEYISTMSRLMYQRNQSEVAKSLQPYEVKESTEPPGKIFYTEVKKKK